MEKDAVIEKGSKATQSIQGSGIPFRIYLQNILLERCQKNSRYSLRAFAKTLGISSSALSAILNGKRPVTDKMKFRLGTLLGLGVHDLGRLQNSKQEFQKKSDIQSAPLASNFHQISLDMFAVISDWYHYAILELTYVKEFKSDPDWISRKLSISKSEANFAIERLIRLKFLTNVNGTWVDTSPNKGFITNIDSEKTSLGSKKLQKQILEKSIQALEELPISKRNHTSLTVTMDRTHLVEAIELITQFRRSFSKKLKEKMSSKNSKNVKLNQPTDVYHLHIGYYPVTKE